MTSFHLIADKRGDHVHVSVWVGPGETSRGRAGELVMRSDEWEAFWTMLALGEASIHAAEHGWSVDFSELSAAPPSGDE